MARENICGLPVCQGIVNPELFDKISPFTAIHSNSTCRETQQLSSPNVNGAVFLPFQFVPKPESRLSR
jgi:hypothetical protein